MTDFDIEDFCKESSINNEDYWFLKLNQINEDTSEKEQKKRRFLRNAIKRYPHPSTSKYREKTNCPQFLPATCLRFLPANLVIASPNGVKQSPCKQHLFLDYFATLVMTKTKMATLRSR